MKKKNTPKGVVFGGQGATPAIGWLSRGKLLCELASQLDDIAHFCSVGSSVFTLRVCFHAAAN